LFLANSFSLFSFAGESLFANSSTLKIRQPKLWQHKNRPFFIDKFKKVKDHLLKQIENNNPTQESQTETMNKIVKNTTSVKGDKK
jgi:hypothetical protein